MDKKTKARFWAKVDKRGDDGQVIDIRNRAMAGARRSTLRKDFGLSATSINYIINRKTWAHV